MLVSSPPNLFLCLPRTRYELNFHTPPQSRVAVINLEKLDNRSTHHFLDTIARHLVASNGRELRWVIIMVDSDRPHYNVFSTEEDEKDMMDHGLLSAQEHSHGSQ